MAGEEGGEMPLNCDWKVARTGNVVNKDHGAGWILNCWCCGPAHRRGR